MKSFWISCAKAICVMTLLCGADPMFGDLIVVDDPRYGASSILQDTATGLDWLNLYKTRDLSYNTVFSNFSQGGTFEGFRYANLAEIGTLFADANIPDIDETSAANAQPVRDLLLEIGTLFGGDPCFCVFSYALNAQSLTPGTHSVSELMVRFLAGGSAIRVEYQSQSDNLISSYTGSFIIRETPQPVPEPRPFALLIAAALGVLCSRWYRRAANPEKQWLQGCQLRLLGCRPLSARTADVRIVPGGSRDAAILYRGGRDEKNPA
jgi:hypothetical protein